MTRRPRRGEMLAPERGGSAAVEIHRPARRNQCRDEGVGAAPTTMKRAVHPDVDALAMPHSHKHFARHKHLTASVAPARRRFGVSAARLPQHQTLYRRCSPRGVALTRPSNHCRGLFYRGVPRSGRKPRTTVASRKLSSRWGVVGDPKRSTNPAQRSTTKPLDRRRHPALCVEI